MKNKDISKIELARKHLNEFSSFPGSTCIIDNVIADKLLYDLAVIVPIYNVGKYVDNCIYSLVNQKTKYKFHIILVDDGSTDNSVSILNKYKNYDCVTIIHQKNQGPAAARNTALNTIDSQYLMFVDGDDMILQGMFEKMLELAFKNDSDIVQCKYIYTDKIPEFESRPLEIKNQKNKYDGFAWGKIFKNKIFYNLGFPKGYKFDDTIIGMITQFRAEKIDYINVAFYIYRNNPLSEMAVRKHQKKSVDSYWITELIMSELNFYKIPYNDAYFKVFIKQMIINEIRALHMPRQIRKDIFILQSNLLNCFTNNVKRHKYKILTIACTKNLFIIYELFCLINYSYCKLLNL